METTKEKSKAGVDVYRLPPLVEWLTFTATQLSSTAEFFTAELSNVVSQYVTKFESDLSREDYKSSKISGRVVREFRQIVDKAIENLNEVTAQAEEELHERFPTIASKARGDKKSSESSIKEDELKNDENASVGIPPDESDSDESCCSTVDGSSPEKPVRKEKSEEDKLYDNVSSDDEVDPMEEPTKDTTEEGDTTERLEEIFENSGVEDEQKKSESPPPTTNEPQDDDENLEEVSSGNLDELPSPLGSEITEFSKEDTVTKPMAKARSPSPTDTVFLGPPKVKVKQEQTSRKSLRSFVRSPSPAETVCLGSKKATESSDEDEERARRLVLSGTPVKNEKKRESRPESTRRSPSPAETVFLGKKKSESDEEEERARRSVLRREEEDSGRNTKSKVDAPFKKPKRVGNGRRSDEESNNSDSSHENYRNKLAPFEKLLDVKSSNASSSLKKTEDWKLQPDACHVVLKRLPEIIMERLQTHNFVVISESEDDDLKVKKRKKRIDDDKDDPLQKALRRLQNFNPILKKRDKKHASRKRDKKGSKRNEKEEDGDITIRDDGSSDSDEGSNETILKRNVRPTQMLSQEVEEINSDDEDLDAKPLELNSSDEERSARKKVLQGSSRTNMIESSDDDSAKDPTKTKGSDKDKKKSKNYYTPAVARIPEPVDSNDDSDDDFVPRKKTRSRAAIRSDSEDSKASKGKKNKSEKRYSTEELSSDSEKSDASSAARKSRRRRRSSSDSDVKITSTKKRRRRIKQVSDSDDSDAPKTKKKTKKRRRGSEDAEEMTINSDSDVAEEATGKGRKNIRGIIGKRNLQKDTRIAEEEEEKRKKRIAERQAQFNELFKPPEVGVIQSLVLDYDPETKEPTVVVDPKITEKLKPHQAEGIRFMWNACFESVQEFKKPNNEGSGCILAHCMGLGKTLQTVAFLHTVLTSKVIGLKTALVICPLNTVANWTNEVKMWTRPADKQLTVHPLYDEKNNESRVDALKCWQRRGGIGIIHYDSFRALVEGKRIKKRLKDSIMECLIDPGADVIVCDEGHVFKNEKSKLSAAVNKIRSKRRVVLTGTPLQNNLVEYHCMMQFVKPNLLGSKKEFLNRFVNPITNGQHKDSTSFDVSLMKKRAHVLHKLLDGCVQRLDYSVLLPYLPPKYEYVVLIKMTEIQNKLYLHYLNSIKQINTVKDLVSGGQLLKHAANLAKVWCHPRALELKHAQKQDDYDSSESAGSLKDFIDDRSDPDDEEDGSDIDWLDDELNVIKNKNKVDVPVKDEPVDEEVDDASAAPPELSADIIEKGGDWWSKFFKSKSDMKFMDLSSKMVVLFEILKTCESIQDKVLVFSQYLYSLDMIEEFLEALDEEAKRTDSQDSFPPQYNSNVSRWRKNIEYFRIDGSTKSHDRQRNCDTFNKKADTSRAKLFLISTKAGGLGINLVGANRVVIFDASWNPSQDMQSIFRVFRFGQTKPCYIYRLLARGTIEEKIYNRQVVKLSLSGRVVDEHQIERHFTFDDMAKMFEYDPDEKTDRPTPDVPKDRLLADLLMSHKDVIDTYLEHDSLLQNQVDQGLTEDERKAAWEEYQNERNRSQMPAIWPTPGPTESTTEILQAYGKMKQRIRTMYPELNDYVLSLYANKVQRDITDLRKITHFLHENRNRMDPTAFQTQVQTMEVKKMAVQAYFTQPGALGRAMQGTIQAILANEQRQQAAAANAAGLSHLNGRVTYSNPLHVHSNPFRQHFSSIFKQNSNQNQSNGLAEVPTITPPRPTIPTMTVPYHPANDEDVVNLD